MSAVDPDLKAQVFAEEAFAADLGRSLFWALGEAVSRAADEILEKHPEVERVALVDALARIAGKGVGFERLTPWIARYEAIACP